MSEDDTEPELGEGDAGLDDDEVGVEEGLGWAAARMGDEAGVEEGLGWAARMDDDEAGVEEGLGWVAEGEVSTGEAEGAYETMV